MLGSFGKKRCQGQSDSDRLSHHGACGISGWRLLARVGGAGVQGLWVARFRALRSTSWTAWVCKQEWGYMRSWPVERCCANQPQGVPLQPQSLGAEPRASVGAVQHVATRGQPVAVTLHLAQETVFQCQVVSKLRVSSSCGPKGPQRCNRTLSFTMSRLHRASSRILDARRGQAVTAASPSIPRPPPAG